MAQQNRQVLVAEDLRKSYGQREALRGLSFSLNAGRILGFLGPNGAGKTTAIRILTTILEPSSGRFLVDGIGSDEPIRLRRRIGVLPESLGFPKSMTGTEFVTFYGRLYGLPTNLARAKAAAMIDAVGLQGRARSLIGTYSRGMRRGRHRARADQRSRRGVPR
jgi:ABC-2 type transport system ATP-binding protein